MTKINNAIRTIILVDITNNNALQNKEINIQDKNVFSQEDKNKLYESKKNKDTSGHRNIYFIIPIALCL